MIQEQNIVVNLIPGEPVIINKIQPLGKMVSLSYIGVNTTKQSSEVISKVEFDNLKVVSDEGSSNFSGAPNGISLCAKDERINTEYQFEALFAVNCSIVYHLPHAAIGILSI